MTGAAEEDPRQAAARLLLGVVEPSLSSAETAAVLAELDALAGDLARLRALRLDYVAAATPDHVVGWIEAGGRCRACERAGEADR